MTNRLEVVTACTWMLLLVLGLVAVTSATQHQSQDSMNPFVLRHILYMIVAVAVFIALLQVPLYTLQKMHKLIYLVTVLLAVLVLVPWIGVEAGGGRRWIDLQVMTLQVSEVARLMIPIYVAGHLASNAEEIRQSTIAVLKPLFWVGIVLVLFLQQPDFGSAVLIGLVTASMLLLAGTRVRDLALLGVIGSIGLAYVAYYRRDRIAAFLDTWTHASDEAYQLAQSLVAFGRGEFTGIGLGDGIQKVLYLPTPHNDFIFSVIVEETGFIGGAFLLLILMGLVFRCLWVGRRALSLGHNFGGYISYAAGLMLGLQTLINVGVSMGALPTKGLTLPFVSYGGNSLLVSSALLALVCRTHYELQSPEKLSDAEAA